MILFLYEPIEKLLKQLQSYVSMWFKLLAN